MQTAKVEELLQVLKERGLNDTAIENVKEGLWSQASEKFMSDLLESLSDGDLEKVETIATQEEANRKLADVFKEKTGKDMQEEMAKAVDQSASELIEKYKVGDSSTIVAGEAEDTIHDLT